MARPRKYLTVTLTFPSVENRYITPGYLVEYGEDGDNYRSWSPKEVFERAYKPSENYYDRMLIEKEEVSERYLKGRQFTFSLEFRKLTEQEQILLRKQLDAMEQYLYILTKRIEVAYARDLSIRTIDRAKMAGRDDAPLAQCTGTV